MITLEMPIGDFLDRFSILTLKLRVTDEVKPEYEAFAKAYERVEQAYNSPKFSTLAYFEALLDVNGKIWELEAQLRRGQEDQSDEAKIQLGVGAIKIRDINRQRKAIMAEVASITQTGWADMKMNHCSS